MKYFITILCLICHGLFANCIIIDTVKDKNFVITGYHVAYYVNPDGSAKYIDYKITDDLKALTAVLGQDQSGLLKTADHIIINLNADNSIERIHYIVMPTGKADVPQQVIKKAADLPPDAQTKTDALNQELQTKPALPDVPIDPKAIQAQDAQVKP